jgi:lipopolysaccharide export system protein LptA
MKDSRRGLGVRTGAVVCAVAALLVAAGVFSADPVTTKVTWETDDMVEFDTSTNIVNILGKARITYEGESDAVMTCRDAIIDLTGKGPDVLRMTARGPVDVKMTTKAPNRKAIDAKCDKSINFDRETDTITLLGNVVAVVHQLDQEDGVSDITLRGNKMTLELKTGKIAAVGSPEAPAAGTLTLPPKKADTPDKEQGQ